MVELVEVDVISIFKNILDKYWTDQEVFNDFNADLTGTGGLPICISVFDRQYAGMCSSELIGLDATLYTTTFI